MVYSHNGITLSDIKELTTDTHNMQLGDTMMSKKALNGKVLIIRFHLYEIPKQTKLRYDDRNRKDGGL